MKSGGRDILADESNLSTGEPIGTSLIHSHLKNDGRDLLAVKPNSPTGEPIGTSLVRSYLKNGGRDMMAVVTEQEWLLECAVPVTNVCNRDLKSHKHTNHT